MPKIKTRRAAAKRFAVTGTGEFKRAKAFKSHILEKKSPARKRNLRKATLVALTIRLIYRNLGGIYNGKSEKGRYSSCTS